MNRMSRLCAAGAWLSLGSLAATSSLNADYAASWIDPDTGHRIVQLSREPGTQSLYFTQNAYTKDGRLIVTTPRGQLELIDVNTGAITPIADPTPAPPPPAELIPERFAHLWGRMHVIETGHRTGSIFFTKGDLVYAMDPLTQTARRVAEVPKGRGGFAVITTVNADETMLAGSITFGQPPSPRREPPRPDRSRYLGGDNLPGKEEMMERRLAARLPMALFTIDLRTGRYREILHSTDWLNHIQFSPTDPTLLLFCHEGPWHDVDRIWFIRTDGSTAPTLVHKRMMRMEIAGHEFWSADGRWIWYDLQTPRGEDFWLAGYNVGTGQRIWYHLDRDRWSVHFNVSPDGTLFSGDGGSEDKNVARAKDGKWIYLFRPRRVPDLGTPKDQDALVQPGVFDYERLVNLKRHDYVLEPNATFTPDMKWIVFRSNMRGSVQVYAVEIAKAGQAR